MRGSGRTRLGMVARAAGALMLLVAALVPSAAARAQSPAPVATDAGATTTTAGAGASPATASVRVLVMLVSGVDLYAGTYDATFYLSMECPSGCDLDG